MAKMNWDRVRKENQVLKHGSASVESGRVTDPPFEVIEETQAFDIRCDPATGDFCHLFQFDGRRALVVIHSIGRDFHSLRMEERKKRILDLLKLIDWGTRKVKEHIEKQFLAEA
jgi:hypothetical protein